MYEGFFGEHISSLYRHGMIYMKRELVPYVVGRGQFMFLLACYQMDGMSQDEVAAVFDIDKSTTARAISKLEKAGYVARKSKGNTNYVYLTLQGKDFEPKLNAILQRWQDILSAGMTPEDRAKALDLLRRMADNAITHSKKGV